MNRNAAAPSAPRSDHAVQVLVAVAGGILCAATAALALALGWQHGALNPRTLVHVLLSMAGAATLVLARRGRVRQASLLLLGTYWSAVTAIAAFNGGVRGPNLLNYPLILLLASWLLGTRAAIVFAVVTEGVCILLLIGDARGWVPPVDWGNRWAHFIFLTGILSMTAAAAIVSQRSYRHRVAELHRALDDLSRSEAIIVQQRDHLAGEVEAKTQALVSALNAAEAASLSKSRFLANMSHEIRTPLNAITGMLYVVRRSGVTARQAESLDKIEVASQHLVDLISGILDLSKIEAGSVTLEEVPLDLAELVQSVADMIGPKAVAKGLALHQEVDPQPQMLLGDRVKLRQALINYAGNALKFTQQGSITLRARVLERTPEATRVRFEVTDTGPGIEPEVVPRLFNVFEQGDNSITRRYGGTGLGLAITRRMADLMGGSTGVETVPGKGSTFWLSVPLRSTGIPGGTPSAETMNDSETQLKNKHAGRRILLAEDEPINREVVEMLLEDVGLVIDTAEDGAQALQRAGATDYALILMDMQMPVMDGLEATRRIRQLPSALRVPIVALTANTFTEDEARCREAGMDDFIGKPVMPEILYGVLLKWLDSGRSVSSP